MQQPIVHIEPDWGVDFGKPASIELHYVECRDDRLHLVGVVQAAIKLNDRLYRLQAKNGDDNPQLIRKFRLRVKSISAYHNSLNRVNAGMTAALELHGDIQGLVDALVDAGWEATGDGLEAWRRPDDADSSLLLTR